VPVLVVLDGFTLNPGDLTWQGLHGLADCRIHDRTTPGQLLPRARGAELLLTNKTVLGGRAIAALPDLRYIGVLATGYNVVDLEAARTRGIPVTHVPAYGTASVAQMVFAHLLNLTQNVAGHAASVRRGAWQQAEDFCYWETPLVELEGLTLGLVGAGRIGAAVARIGQAFGMRVIAHDPAAPSLPAGIEPASLDAVFEQADVVSLHCPLTPQTERLVNRERLARMKPTAFLINTSRGPVVDEAALAEALNAGRLAGAGLDVLSQEPPRPGNPLLAARNCHLTPHIAWATRAARNRLMDIAVDNVRAFLDGTPRNVVNGPLPAPR